MRELKNKDEQYTEYLRYKTTPQKNELVGSLLSVFGVAIVGFICAFVCYSALVHTPRVNTEGGDKKQSFIERTDKKDKKTFSIPFFNKRQNILVLGVDSNGENTDRFEGTRSDTILLFNLDPRSRSINAISIPRDSKVYLADNRGIQKINHAHAIGGIDLAKKTIEETLGIKIDRYIVINTEGVKKVVDILGGIPVYVEKPLNYDDYSGNLHIHLKKGEHVLNGEQAEGFLRFRHDGLGDIGRTSRQQWFLTSFLDAIKSPSALTKIPEALKVGMSYIKTDLTLYELSHLAAMSRDIDMNAVEVATLPGQPSTKGYISYWILDPEKTQEVVDRMIYRAKPETSEALTAGIMYATSKEDEAIVVKTKLEELGYEVNCIGKGRVPHSQVIAHQQAVTTESVSRLKRKIPEIKNLQFVYDPIRMYCVKSDFTIIISEN